ncbi:RHS repeat-associated core domain-containing protein [Kribbella sp. NPDC055071]
MLGLPEKVIEPSTTAHPADADRTWTASYDAAGNAVSLLSPGGVQRTRAYDAAGRLTKEEGNGAEASTTARNLTYDLAGRLATSSSLDGVNTYSYNDRSMLLRADGPSGTSTQGYDPDGQLTQRIDAAGTADFTYVNGRPTTETDPVTRTLHTLGYNAAGQLSTIDYGSSRIRTIGYDAYGRMNSDVLKAGAASVSSITYGYDADNNITSKNTTGVAGAGNNTYVYDQLGRLTSWTKGSTTTQYGWDAASNRIKAGTKLASYDERNRLISDGTSTYTYTPRGAMQSKTTGTTTEAFTFDAFDRMISRFDRDFTYDALDRPVQAGTARMRYDGFSDEVVSDGTQFFGRSASDGLLSIGYDTTKRLVLADRHGDVIAGFDPTDTTLGTGLPDTRTFDPFGNSTSATGLKYRVGYQGDWTDPRSGDVNEGARWYDPESATFNSRDTITSAAGESTATANLYTYTGGNPLTFNDPDGHRAVDPDGNPMKRVCWWTYERNGDGHPGVYHCKWISDPPPTDCRKTHTCPPPKCPPGGSGKNCPVTKCPPGTSGPNCTPDCKKHCDPPPTKCKTRCGRTPPPPPCDAQCQLRKKIQQEQEDIENDAKTKKQPPPGDPSCANGNPALCSVDPSQPATIVGPGGDLTSETSQWSDQQYQNALNQYGSVVATVGKTENIDWFNMGFNPRGDTAGTGGASVGPGGAIGSIALGTALGQLIKNLTLGGQIWSIASGGDDNSSTSNTDSNAGATAQPPDPDDDHRGGGHEPENPGGDLGPDWKPRPSSDVCNSSGCEEVARDIQQRIGGEIYRIKPPQGAQNLGRYRDEWSGWGHHDVVVRGGRVYDAFSDRRGVPIDQYKNLWKDMYPQEFPF